MMDSRKMKETIRRRNMGQGQDQIALALGVSQMTISRWLRFRIPAELLRLPCQWCKKPLPSSQATSGVRYHPDCREASLAHARHSKARRVRTSYQRKNPDGYFECVALDEYQRRDYTAIWLPHKAPFDYMVNGLRVDVKGARLNSKHRWQFGLPGTHKGRLADIPWRAGDRCDILHLIGRGELACRHFILPAELAGDRALIVFSDANGEIVCPECGMQFRNEVGLIHHKRWCGTIPNWFAYENNWWRLEKT